MKLITTIVLLAVHFLPRTTAKLFSKLTGGEDTTKICNVHVWPIDPNRHIYRFVSTYVYDGRLEKRDRMAMSSLPESVHNDRDQYDEVERDKLSDQADKGYDQVEGESRYADVHDGTVYPPQTVHHMRGYPSEAQQRQDDFVYAPQQGGPDPAYTQPSNVYPQHNPQNTYQQHPTGDDMNQPLPGGSGYPPFTPYPPLHPQYPPHQAASNGNFGGQEQYEYQQPGARTETMKIKAGADWGDISVVKEGYLSMIGKGDLYEVINSPAGTFQTSPPVRDRFNAFIKNMSEVSMKHGKELKGRLSVSVDQRKKLELRQPGSKNTVHAVVYCDP